MVLLLPSGVGGMVVRSKKMLTFPVEGQTADGTGQRGLQHASRRCFADGVIDNNVSASAQVVGTGS